METLYPSSFPSNWMIHQTNNSTTWTKEENKRFESALALVDEKTPNRWFRVAEMIPGKSVYDVINQYRVLVADVIDIEAGLVPIPGYLASSFTLELADHRGFHDVFRKRGRSSCDQERKKGVPWTEDEHRRFLLGLEKHGKGDWRNISRNYVISKTPTQVASHAQKYYLRQQISAGKDKRRPSIHDITTVNLTAVTSPPETQTRPPKSNELVTTAKTAGFDWNNNSSLQCNNGNSMVFGSSCGDSYVAYPHDFATRGGRYIERPRFHS